MWSRTTLQQCLSRFPTCTSRHWPSLGITLFTAAYSHVVPQVWGWLEGGTLEQSTPAAASNAAVVPSMPLPLLDQPPTEMCSRQGSLHEPLPPSAAADAPAAPAASLPRGGCRTNQQAPFATARGLLPIVGGKAIGNPLQPYENHVEAPSIFSLAFSWSVCPQAPWQKLFSMTRSQADP